MSDESQTPADLRDKMNEAFNYTTDYFLAGLLTIFLLAAAVFFIVTVVVWGPVVAIGWCVVQWLKQPTFSDPDNGDSWNEPHTRPKLYVH